MFCPYCGNEIDKDSDVCLKCGKFLIKKNNENKSNDITKWQGIGIAGFVLSFFSLFVSLRILFNNIITDLDFSSTLVLIVYLFINLSIEFIMALSGFILSSISRMKKSDFWNLLGILISMISFCIMAIITLLIIVK